MGCGGGGGVYVCSLFIEFTWSQAGRQTSGTEWSETAGVGLQVHTFKYVNMETHRVIQSRKKLGIKRSSQQLLSVFETTLIIKLNRCVWWVFQEDK